MSTLDLFDGSSPDAWLDSVLDGGMDGAARLQLSAAQFFGRLACLYIEVIDCHGHDRRVADLMTVQAVEATTYAAGWAGRYLKTMSKVTVH